MYAQSDVILAIASPPGRSLRGIIRLSGDATFHLLQHHILGWNETTNIRRSAHAVRLHLNGLQVPAIAFFMPSPHSYTSEHSAELQLPGNPVLLERLIDRLIDSARTKNIPARRATPGEFTARAFLNGRISLTQAEGVAATIAAQSDAELRAAHLLISGSLGDFAHAVANDLANALALVEAGIDFTDQEDVVAISPNDLHRRLVGLQDQINDQLHRSVGMEQIEAIPWVVLVGNPNAGKSALFNALLGHERAVVSPVSGTTRDVIAEPLTIETAHGHAEVMLIDLAGLDSQEGFMNQLMQAAARQAIERAELKLRCLPMNEELLSNSNDEILIRTKIDLVEDHKFATPSVQHIGVSALTGQGIDALRALIAQRLADRAVSLAADATALRPRHEAAMRSALVNLNDANALVSPMRHERALTNSELIASIMRSALDDLAALAGDISPDDVLGRVFATFCIGK